MNDIGPALRSPEFADAEIGDLFSPSATLERYGAFETELARAQAMEGLVMEAAAVAIGAAAVRFVADTDRLRACLIRDGIAVPEYVAQLRATVGEPHASSLHLGVTSQDVVDTAMALAILAVNGILATRLDALLTSLDELSERLDDAQIMGRTRMQDALPIRATHRVAQWRAPVEAARKNLHSTRPQVESVQLGGPVGDRRGMAGRGDAVALRIALMLGLSNAPCWHTDRSRITGYGGSLATIAGACGKLGRDIALMAQMGEIGLAGGGGSSSMPHKQNPVRAEALVALAGHAATLAGGLQHAMLHEQERSGAAWALESLLLPPLCESAGASLRVAGCLIASIRWIGR